MVNLHVLNVYQVFETERPIVQELLRTNDIVVISLIESLLNECGIQHLILDANMSVLEGSVGAIRRRIMVDGERIAEAKQLLRDAELGHELDE